MKVSIIIPAYNEERRIKNTLEAYTDFFNKKDFGYELLIVINGTTDSTPAIVESLQQSKPHILMIEIPQGGKGLAIDAGFKNALERNNDLIGFVDADMATSPEAFNQLIKEIDDYDAIIASRYMPGAQVTPPRPFVKRWGSKIFFETLTRLLFGIKYYDTQCGAKLFKREVIEKITPYLSVRQWAFDIEILYLCKRFGFTVKEQPTIWHDKAGSKLRMMRAGSRMLGTLFRLRWHYWFAHLN
jgi:glycosyltransferase involved in cell wall biosynthesis